MSGHTHTHIYTYTHTYTQDNYSNPCCACVPRVNYWCFCFMYTLWPIMNHQVTALTAVRFNTYVHVHVAVDGQMKTLMIKYVLKDGEMVHTYM